MSKEPCDDCPWRKDAPAGHWHPDHFQSIWSGCQDDGVSLMLCHKAAGLPPERAAGLLCRGWILVIGTDAIAVRLLLLQKRIKRGDLRRPRGCPELYATFEEMLRAQGLEPPRRNRVTGG